VLVDFKRSWATACRETRDARDPIPRSQAECCQEHDPDGRAAVGRYADQRPLRQRRCSSAITSRPRTTRGAREDAGPQHNPRPTRVEGGGRPVQSGPQVVAPHISRTTCTKMQRNGESPARGSRLLLYDLSGLKLVAGACNCRYLQLWSGAA